MENILLGQLGANGDCLYATILARQLKADFPFSRIEWAISSQCAGLLKGNPYIEDVWEIQVPGWDKHEMAWQVFEREAFRLHKQRKYDRILLSQIWPNNFQNFDGTIRPSILRSYGKPITVPIENVLCLTFDEIERVEKFAREQGIEQAEYRILFECSSKSGQSFITPDQAQDIASKVYRVLPQAMVIFSTHLPMDLKDSRSRYAGSLSLREVAHLTKYCTLFVGAGSGTTVVVSSSASAVIPMLLLLASSTSVFASFQHDFEFFDIDRPILETASEDTTAIANLIVLICKESFAAASHHHTPIAVNFSHYRNLIDLCLLRKFRYLDAARSLMVTAKRYGWVDELIAFGQEHIRPNLRLDPSWLFKHSRIQAEEFLAALDDAARAPLATPVQNRFSQMRLQIT
jgi:hypothetical protein